MRGHRKIFRNLYVKETKRSIQLRVGIVNIACFVAENSEAKG